MKLLLTVPETAAALGIGRSKVYELIKRGDLRSIRLDGSRRIPVADLHAFIEGLEEVAA